MIDARRSAAWDRTMMRWSGLGRAMTGRRLALAVALAGLGIVGLVGVMRPYSAPSGQTAPSGVGTDWGVGAAAGGLDVVDLVTKGALVLILLFVTLRILGRAQGATAKKGGQLVVLESRSLASKASLHLVAVGDRRLVVGLTPSGMVSLAELDAAELGESRVGADAADPDEQPAGSKGSQAPGPALDPLLAPLDRVGARLFALFGGGRAR